MAILGVTIAYVMSGAEESARVAKTRSLIARLHSLVMQKYESYRYRRLPVAIPSGLTVAQVAQVRCDVTRQLMRLEMPDRWYDIADNPTDITLPKPNSASARVITMQRPTASQAYLAFYNSVARSSNFLQHGADHEGAKCLFLIVTMGLDDADVMENFSEHEFADVDQTGCKVFVDAWGNPIEFLRWAPGFASPLQPESPDTSSGRRDIRMRDQTDPTSVYGSPQPGPTARAGAGRVRGNTFALFPLIYSAGPDGHYDLVTERDSNEALRYSATIPHNDPFVSLYDRPNFADGPIGAAAVFPARERNNRSPGNADNIHNHLIGAR